MKNKINLVRVNVNFPLPLVQRVKDYSNRVVCFTLEV